MPSKAQHRPYPCRNISIRSIQTEVLAYLFCACSRSGNSLPRHRADGAEISLWGVGLLRCKLLLNGQKTFFFFLSHTSVISVTNIPGAIALARMLCLAYSDDKVFVKWFRAALLAL